MSVGLLGEEFVVDDDGRMFLVLWVGTTTMTRQAYPVVVESIDRHPLWGDVVEIQFTGRSVGGPIPFSPTRHVTTINTDAEFARVMNLEEEE